MTIPPLDDYVVTDKRIGALYVHQLRQDIPYLEAFCRKNKVLLEKVALCAENYPRVEIMYVFNDGLGGYTIAGIRDLP